jgi:DNA-directed RNA polymerase subunit RPC12/RpoP
MEEETDGMICPKCGERIYNTYLCDNCGHDSEDDLGA